MVMNQYRRIKGRRLEVVLGWTTASAEEPAVSIKIRVFSAATLLLKHAHIAVLQHGDGGAWGDGIIEMVAVVFQCAWQVIIQVGDIVVRIEVHPIKCASRLPPNPLRQSPTSGRGLKELVHA